MSNKTSPLFLVQVREEVPPDAEPAIGKLPQGASPIRGFSASELIYEAISPQDIIDAIDRICGAVSTGLSKASPQSCSVEFSLGFKAGAKIPVLLAGEATGGLKITLSWKKE